ncbi:hypothetical protein QT999_23480 [Microcoleus sp. S36b_A2]
MLRKTFFGLIACVLIFCTAISSLEKAAMAVPLTVHSPVLAETQTLDRVVDTAIDLAVDTIGGAVKDIADFAGALFESDVANPEGSQPLPGETAENFRERTQRSQSHSSPSTSTSCGRDAC